MNEWVRGMCACVEKTAETNIHCMCSDGKSYILYGGGLIKLAHYTINFTHTPGSPRWHKKDVAGLQLKRAQSFNKFHSNTTFKSVCACARKHASYLSRSALQSMPDFHPTPAVLYAAHEDLYLTVSQSFPFQKTHPVLSVLTEEMCLCLCLELHHKFRNHFYCSNTGLEGLTIGCEMCPKLGEHSFGNFVTYFSSQTDVLDWSSPPSPSITDFEVHSQEVHEGLGLSLLNCQVHKGSLADFRYHFGRYPTTLICSCLKFVIGMFYASQAMQPAIVNQGWGCLK